MTALSATRRYNRDGRYHDGKEASGPPKTRWTKIARAAIPSLFHPEAETRVQLLNKKLTSAMTANIPTQKRQNWAVPPDACGFSAKW
jgi:hypothetical protein